MWRRCIAAAYAPEAIYGASPTTSPARSANRPAYPRSPQRASWRERAHRARPSSAASCGGSASAATTARTFWRVAGPALRAGQVEELIQTAVVSHHLIEFTRECLRGAQEASFYAPSQPPPLRLRPEKVSS